MGDDAASRLVPAVAPPRVAEVAARVARTDLPVLIVGESGSGKSHLARWIHSHSCRAEQPLVEVSCAALSPEEIGTALFDPGNGVDSTRSQRGPLIAAEGCTLLLKTVEEFPAEAQRRLLRLLTERRAGQRFEAPREVGVRVIATSSPDLGALVSAGRFRVDLYYRLNVVHLELPPLRERPDQIEALARHFVRSLAGDRTLGFTSALLEVMRRRAWPGNIRELRNACEQLVACCPHEALRLEDLPRELDTDQVLLDGPNGSWLSLPPDGVGLFELERSLIRRVLERERGNVTHAAAYLRIPRHILAYRMRKYGIHRS